MTPLIHRLSIQASLVLVHLVLLLYPTRFRHRFSVDVERSVRADLDSAAALGTWRLLAACAQSLGDATKGLLPEHRRERAQSRARKGRTAMVVDSLREDLKQAARALRASPTFTIVAVSVLGLAIGAGTAIFSLVDAVVLRALPFDRSDRIVSVLEYVPESGRPGGAATPQTFLEWKSNQRSFAQFAAVNRINYASRNERGEPANVRGMRITHDFMSLLRVRPFIGRPFAEQDEAPGRERVAILSYGFWQRRFGGSQDGIGRAIELNGRTHEIVGVMRRDFSYPVGSSMAAEVFTPIAFRSDERVRANSRSFVYGVLGRLNDEVSIEQASDDMNRIAAALDAQYPKWNPGGRVRVVRLRDAMVERVRSWMLMLLGAVALVLLIACANVANLMLVRSTVRARELGIRAALGAGRWRIARALLVEGVLLSSVATLLGVGLAWFGVQVLTAWLPEGLPRVTSIAIDLRVLTAAAGAALMTGVVFGLAPAYQSSRADLTLAFKDGRTSTAGASARRLRSALVVAEVALAVVLLVGAGLFISSFVGLFRVNLGFDYRDVLVINISQPFERGDDFKAAMQRGTIYIQQALDAVSRVPGVEQAGSVSGGLPLSGGWQSSPFELPGRQKPEGIGDEVHTRWVSPDYLRILRIPLVRGRHITPEDHAGAAPIALVNQSAARTFWPDSDALGQRIIIEERQMTVVGVVGDIRHGGLEGEVQPEAYVPLAQDAAMSGTLVMRTTGNPLTVLPAVKAAIWSVNPEQLFFTDTYTMEGHMNRLIAQRRFNMALLAIFGVLGLVIAAGGIYGVMAYAVAQRTSEIGVRMALGATRRNVMVMILGNAGVLMVVGLAIGSIAAWYLSATVRTFLFQVEPTDGRVFAIALATLALAGFSASALPARRAAAVDPVIALRQQ